MTTILWLIFGLIFWPTQEQMAYCYEARYSQEMYIKLENWEDITFLKEKSKICDLIINNYKNEGGIN